MRQSNRGRTFLARGGNGQLTEPQKALASVLYWPVEYAIPTAPVKGRFESLPNHYKVDLAHPILKIAIEVDGRSHRTPKWKFLDRRKEQVLSALGWSVLRFTNEQVLGELSTVAAAIIAFTTSKWQETTTTSPTA